MSAPGPRAAGWQLVLAAFTQRQLTDDLPKLTTATFIGIMVAITGNVLISLALNLQKLAHRRVEADTRARQQQEGPNGKDINGATSDPQNRRSDRPSLDEHDEDRLETPEDPVIPVETQSLIPFPNTATTASPRDYGSVLFSDDHRVSEEPQPPLKLKETRSFVSRLIPGWARSQKVSRNTQEAALQASSLPVDVVFEETVLERQPTGQKSSPKLGVLEEGNEADYLKSKLWWLGFLLMNVGEMGNFISYAWAPASVVAPLGTFALMANCLFAPLLLGERFRKRDLLGVLIAIIGAVTVVLASNASDARLDPDALLLAISQVPFIVYSCIYIVGAIILATLSHGNIGRQWVFVDVGLCALFGGFTVLSTKAISTLLTMQWIEMFSSWITYPVLAVLVFTGVGQIRYLNRALMRFDSKVVIPVQFVLFTLSAIIGSAILYGDFKTAKFHQIVTFLYGCAATFLGVFIIAWAPNSQDDDASDDGEDVDVSDDGSAAVNEESRLGIIGRRRRATLILPSGIKDAPILRSPHNAISLIGLSPAQHLLLVHTPPREVPTRPLHSPDRRRTMSWLGDGARDGASPGGTWQNSLTGRLRHGAGVRVGSLDQNTYRR